MPPIQLARNVKPLLTTVNGKPRKNDVKSMEEPEDVTGPPIDTDENDTDEPDFGDPHYDSTDDEPMRGDISRSDFRPVSTSRKPGSVTGRGGTTLTAQDNGTPQRSSARSGRKRAVEGIEDPDADEPGVSSPNKRAKTINSTHSPFLGSHMDDGFLVDKKIGPPKARYGKKAGRMSKPISTSRESTPRRKFERVKSMSESVSPQQTKKFNALIPGSENSSPFKSPRNSKVSKLTIKEGDSSSLSDIDSEEVLSDPPRPDNGRRHGQKRKQRLKEEETKRQPKKTAKNKSRQLSADEGVSQRREFKMPDGYNDFASATELAGIDMPLYPDTTTDKNANMAPDKAPCPMCDEPVDKQWLSEYSKGQRMSIARQAKFCHQHKKRSARELWKVKGYPEVDWEQLESRIGAHRAYLESLINGAESHFGERLREKIRTGKNRTLFTTDDYPVPGYYGLRGMSAMTESIIDTFSSLLRERAPHDRLISARGHTGYVQSVLVPELGMRLIKEDMGITDDDEARGVMRESRAVGIILNDERAEPRVSSQAQAQAQAVDNGGDDHKDAALGADNNASGTDGENNDDDGKVDLRIQRVDDSDSDVSSLSSLGAHGLRATRKGRVDDGNSELGGLASLRNAKEPIALGKDVVDDSDSDLSSLASLDKL